MLRLISSLISFNGQNDTDAEKIKEDVVIVFTQHASDTSPSTVVSLSYKLSTPHGYFSNPEHILNQPATLPLHYAELQFDDIDESCSVRNDT